MSVRVRVCARKHAHVCVKGEGKNIVTVRTKCVGGEERGGGKWPRSSPLIFCLLLPSRVSMATSQKAVCGELWIRDALPDCGVWRRWLTLPPQPSPVPGNWWSAPLKRPSPYAVFDVRVCRLCGSAKQSSIPLCVCELKAASH